MRTEIYLSPWKVLIYYNQAGLNSMLLRAVEPGNENAVNSSGGKQKLQVTRHWVRQQRRSSTASLADNEQLYLPISNIFCATKFDCLCICNTYYVCIQIYFPTFNVLVSPPSPVLEHSLQGSDRYHYQIREYCQ